MSAEQCTFVRVLHPLALRLHWQRAGQDAALCQARVPLGQAWQPPTSGVPLALYRQCPDCAQALRTYTDAALRVEAGLPSLPAPAGTR